MDDWTCIFCDEPIGMFDKVCKHCGTRQFGENDEYYPDDKSMRKARFLLNNNSAVSCKQNKRNDGMFSDEEKLALGLYPEDEGMKMSLISRILKPRR